MQEILEFIKHHTLLNTALFGVLFALILLELINHSNASVIDLRPASAFTEGHVIGALSVPHSELVNKSKKIEKLKVQPLILVCANGVDSVRAAVTLGKQGFDVRVLDGGIRAWRDAEMPLVKG
jgi:rhodanese-related sulfurtransferase